jgi:large subunit ribosomal protein L17
MVHRVSHKKLSRDTNARRALMQNLATNLVLHERVVTTTAKAKAVRPFVEKLVTKAKEDSQVSRRYLSTKLDKKMAVEKMVELVGPTFRERSGGYTRITRMAPRVGDRANVSIIEFVENISEEAAKKKLEEKKPQVKAKKDARKGKTKQKATKEKPKQPLEKKKSKSKTSKIKKGK